MIHSSNSTRVGKEGRETEVERERERERVIGLETFILSALRAQWERYNFIFCILSHVIHFYFVIRCVLCLYQ